MDILDYKLCSSTHKFVQAKHGKKDQLNEVRKILYTYIIAVYDMISRINKLHIINKGKTYL